MSCSKLPSQLVNSKSGLWILNFLSFPPLSECHTKSKGLYMCIVHLLLLHVSKSLINIKPLPAGLVIGKTTYLEKLPNALEAKNFLVISKII